jgi:hypothetical protein
MRGRGGAAFAARQKAAVELETRICGEFRTSIWGNVGLRWNSTTRKRDGTGPIGYGQSTVFNVRECGRSDEIHQPCGLRR